MNEKNDPENFPHKELTYKIIGVCMEVHRKLGHGFLEVVYKDAIEYELRSRGISYSRERKYEIEYKKIILLHFYVSDFLIEDDIILEVKTQNAIVDANYKQVINYLAVSKCNCGLLVNFGEPSLQYRRIILTRSKGKQFLESA